MDLPSLEAQKEVTPGECAICYEVYRTSSKSRAPKTLQCGHSLCLHCLRKLVCHSLLLTFVVCPFCRKVTIVPEEGVQALKTDKETLCRASTETAISRSSEDASPQSSRCSTPNSSPTLSIDRAYSARPSIFTVSDVVPLDQGQLWGGRYRQEVRSTYLLGITRRVALSEAHPSPASTSISADGVRICFALGLIVTIACVFFIIIFFFK